MKQWSNCQMRGSVFWGFFIMSHLTVFSAYYLHCETSREKSSGVFAYGTPSPQSSGVHSSVPGDSLFCRSQLQSILYFIFVQKIAKTDGSLCLVTCATSTYALRNRVLSFENIINAFLSTTVKCVTGYFVLIIICSFQCLHL